MRLENVTPSIWTISDGAPQGCELSPLLFSLCASGDLPVKTIGFIPNNDESIQTGGLSWFLVQLEQPRAVWI